MRVLQVIDSLAAGGAENMAVRIANALVDEVEFSGLVATRKGGPLQESLDSTVHYFELNRRSTLEISAVRKLRMICKENSITAIHAHSSSVYIAALATMGMDGPKIVLHDHNPRLAERRELLDRIAGKLANHIIVVSDNIAAWNLSIGVRPTALSVIPNFVDSAHGGVSPARGLPGSPHHRVVAVANLRPEKNHLRLISAFGEVVAKLPDAHLLLVGSLDNDQHVQSVRDMISSRGLAASVSLLGTRTDIPEILAACDIGVLVSVAEGFPLALIEYGLAGLPVVATPVGQIPEIVGRDQGATLVDPDDDSAIASAIVNLLANRDAQAKIGHKLNDLVRTHYSASAVIPKLVSLYE